MATKKWTKPQAVAFVKSHDDHDTIDGDDLDAAFLALYGRLPDSKDIDEGIWGLLDAAADNTAGGVRLLDELRKIRSRIMEAETSDIRQEVADLCGLLERCLAAREPKLRSYSCSNGHGWQATDEEDKAAARRCPECGEYEV